MVNTYLFTEEFASEMPIFSSSSSSFYSASIKTNKLYGLLPIIFAKKIEPFNKLFPSLLSNLENMHFQIRLFFYAMNKATITERYNYLKEYNLFINKLYKNNKYPKFDMGIDHLEISKLSTYPSADELRSWIQKEQRVRTAMRRLVQLWIYKKYKLNIINNTDPWTLSPPTNSVDIFDARSRGIYKFEASSLKKHMEVSLGYSEWLFPTPNPPKNPFTNIPFNEGQLGTILKGIRCNGYGSWMIESYAASSWNIKQFRNDNSIQLKIYSMKQLVNSPESAECAELLEDFIEEQYYNIGHDNIRILVGLKWAIKNKIHEPYMQEWLELFKKNYILKVRYSLTSYDSYKLYCIYDKAVILFSDMKTITRYSRERIKDIRAKQSQAVSSSPVPENDIQLEQFEITSSALIEAQQVIQIQYIITLLEENI